MTLDYALIDWSRLGTTEPEVTHLGCDSLTVLRCCHGNATKVLSAEGSKAARIGKFFDYSSLRINSIYDLHSALHSISTDPKSYVIRGAPLSPDQRSAARRYRGKDPTVSAASRRWICLDLDLDGETPAGDPAEALADILWKSPDLRDVMCVYQLSASWGIKPGIRAHIWYWLDAPRDDAQCLRWIRSLPISVDPALYNPVQPHYTAAPICDGVPDPCPKGTRIGLIPGQSEALHLPDSDAISELAHWESAIMDLGESGAPRHPTVNRAAYSLGGYIASGAISAEDIETRLMEACAQSGAFDEGRITTMRDEVRRALADGARAPRDSSDWREGLMLSDKGVPISNTHNLMTALSLHPALDGAIGFDVRRGVPLATRRLPWDREGLSYPRELRDEDDVRATAWINRLGFTSAGVARVNEALTAVAQQCPRDNVTEYLEGLPVWDGTPRLDSWLTRSCGVADSVYHRAVGSKFLISMVARALDPGCKCDHMIVLVGPQGSYKSTLLETLAAGAGQGSYSDGIGDLYQPQNYIPAITGPWLIEEGELQGFSRRDVETVKRFLTIKSDRHRLSYQRRAVDIPRRCVFAATTNNQEPLQDATGGRRFWPVDVQQIDIPWVRENRDQLFAEALYCYRRGDTWHLDGAAAEAAAQVQLAHTEQDAWVTPIVDWIDQPSAGDYDTAGMARAQCTLAEILTGALQIPTHQWGRVTSCRVSAILRGRGWTRHRIREAGTPTWIWRRPCQ